MLTHRLRPVLVFGLALGLLAAAVPAAASASTRSTSGLTVPITGAATSATGTAYTLTGGSLNIQSFRASGGQLLAVGTLTGTLTNTLTGATQTISALVQIPVSSISGSCQILHLTLGPLDLNLLGLMVHLNQVVLDISAQQGPGNLLGNLLCAVANLLNSNASLTGLAQLLNQVLAAL